jgi:hypothetical protein
VSFIGTHGLDFLSGRVLCGDVPSLLEERGYLVLTGKAHPAPCRIVGLSAGL